MPCQDFDVRLDFASSTVSNARFAGIIIPETWSHGQVDKVPLVPACLSRAQVEAAAQQEREAAAEAKM